MLELITKESDVITEGFKCSIETHGLIYDTLVSDADSNVYKSIMDNNIYRENNIVPKRILCMNHLLGNLCKKLTKVSKITQTKGYRIKGFVQLRKIIGDNVLTIRARVEELIRRRVSEGKPWTMKVDELKKDILNIPSQTKILRV